MTPSAAHAAKHLAGRWGRDPDRKGRSTTRGPSLNWRMVCIVSVGLNLSLAALWVWRAGHTSPIEAAAPAAGPAPVADATSAPAVQASPPAAPPPSPPASFHWRQIEASDYPTYIANLRAVGCPEHVIREAVAQDIHATYDRLRRWPQVPLDPWAPAETRKAWKAQDRERCQQLYAAERAALKELLGNDWPADATDGYLDDSYVPGVLSHLTPDQAKRLLGKIIEINEAAKQLDDRLQRVRLPSDEDVIRLAAHQWRAELAAGMSPAEWEETRLRVLARIRKETGDLGGILLGISAEQARELMAIQARLFDARGVDPIVALAAWDSDLFDSDPDGDDSINAEFKREARRFLGEETFRAFELADDSSYREAARFVFETHLPDREALALYDLRNAAEQERGRILESAGFTRDQRAYALARLRQQAVGELQQRLGSLTAVYLESNQGWLDGLTNLPPRPNQ